MTAVRGAFCLPRSQFTFAGKLRQSDSQPLIQLRLNEGTLSHGRNQISMPAMVLFGVACLHWSRELRGDCI
ncbi:hypothetical protein [Stieleria bergensis]|uniref:hypothetical protein n=1 Tax=Stieleria bergensis TaxID=2528025 RepID=UPI003AF3BD6C